MRLAVVGGTGTLGRLVAAERVARVLAAFGRAHHLRAGIARGGIVSVNGLPGLLLDDGEAVTDLSFTIDAGRIVALDALRNPEKLRHIARPRAAFLP